MKNYRIKVQSVASQELVGKDGKNFTKTTIVGSVLDRAMMNRSERALVAFDTFKLEAAQLRSGDIADIAAYAYSREYNSKWYTSLEATSVAKVVPQGAEIPAEAAQPKSDDLPF